MSMYVYEPKDIEIIHEAPATFFIVCIHCQNDALLTDSNTVCRTCGTEYEIVSYLVIKEVGDDGK